MDSTATTEYGGVAHDCPRDQHGLYCDNLSWHVGRALCGRTDMTKGDMEERFGVFYEWLLDPDIRHRVAADMDAIVSRYPYEHDEAGRMAAFEGPRAAAVHATILREMADIAEQQFRAQSA